MMNRAVRWIGTVLILLLVLASAAYSVELGDYGFTVRNQGREGSLTVWNVTDPGGRRYSVASPRELTEAQVERVLEIADVVFGFDYIEPSGVRIAFEGNVPEVVMIPSEFSYDGYDLVPAIPSGLTFLFGEVVEYNFRMFVDGLFLRLQGQFFTEEQFADRLVRAARNPAAFVQSQDPEFLLLRINELESQLEALLARVSADEQALAEATETVTEALNATTDRISETEASLGEAIVQSTTETRAELSEAQTALNQRIDGLATGFAQARYGNLVEHNRGFFGGVLDAPDPAVVDRIVEIKTATPEIEINAVRDLLREEEINVPPQVIRIVFALYFNSFEE